jgi:hypothetical protein
MNTITLDTIDDLIYDLIRRNLYSDFKGYDPYDFSGSQWRIFGNPGTGIKSKLSYLNKVSPVNLRPLLKIPKTSNAKANALFLHSLALLDHEFYEKEINRLFNWFLENRPGEFEPYFSSGFSFKISLSGYTSGPGKTSLIISLFTVFAFIELYRKTGKTDYLDPVISFKDLIADKLPSYEDKEILYYSYHFDQLDETFNATAKIGRMYALLYKHVSQDEDYRDKIRKILNYLVIKQRSDGSWPYSDTQGYSDSFHTTFILESIHSMLQVYEEDPRHHEMYNKGLSDYKTGFFKNGIPVHFHRNHHNSGGRGVIGVELRDCANAVILFTIAGDMQAASEILAWTLRNLTAPDKVYFYKNRFWTSRIDFIRWNAWLLYTLIIYRNGMDHSHIIK